MLLMTLIPTIKALRNTTKDDLRNCRKLKEYMVNNTTEAGRVIVFGKGEIEPVQPNDTEGNRNNNSRLEFERSRKTLREGSSTY